MSSSTETSMSRQPLAGVLGNVTDLRGRREVHRGLFMALSLTYPDRINPPLVAHAMRLIHSGV